MTTLRSSSFFLFGTLDDSVTLRELESLSTSEEGTCITRFSIMSTLTLPLSSGSAGLFSASFLFLDPRSFALRSLTGGLFLSLLLRFFLSGSSLSALLPFLLALDLLSGLTSLFSLRSLGASTLILWPPMFVS